MHCSHLSLRHTGASRYLARFREIPVFTGMTLLHFGFTTVSNAWEISAFETVDEV